MKLPRRVLACREIHLASSGLAAGVDGLLDGGPRVIGLASAGSVVVDIENALGGSARRRKGNGAGTQEAEAGGNHPAIMQQTPCDQQELSARRNGKGRIA